MLALHSFDCELFSSHFSKSTYLTNYLEADAKKMDTQFCFLYSHSLIRGVLIQRCSAGAYNFTNYVFCHPQFSDVIQNIENCCAILTPVCLCQLLYQNNQFYRVKNQNFEILLLCHNNFQYFG